VAQVLPEAMVVEDWLRRTGGTGAFITARDGPVAVLDPGRRNDDHGADFTNALLANSRHRRRRRSCRTSRGPCPAPLGGVRRKRRPPSSMNSASPVSKHG
jgi:hypothetical protein